MGKMREFKFTNEKDEPIEGIETVTDMSFKKAVLSYQGGTKAQEVEVEWTTKRGEEFYVVQKLPIGRKIRQAIIQQKVKEALKAKKSAGR